MKNLISSFLILLLLSACSWQSGRYKYANDSTPTRIPTATELIDAVPKVEPYSRGGNKNYQVRGKHYQVLPHANNFKQQGIASWYGKKFHGHLTSNGEIYDMYGMSAAHKNLPLPTYVKVTNLNNQKSVIVRVNDRGPFHHQRVIDLSYSAAYKLDMLKTGTAEVEITVLTTLNDPQQKKTSAAKTIPLVDNNSAKNKIVTTPLTASTVTFTQEKIYIQVLATRNAALAKSTATSLTHLHNKTFNYPQHNGVFRVQVGPLSDSETLKTLLLRIQATGYPEAYPRTVTR